MSTLRRTPAGATRTCPHCRAVILQSTSVCPSCRKHLRFSAAGGDAAVPTFSPLRIEGTIRHPNNGEAWEYAVTVTITNERGVELTRQIVGVGAIKPSEIRNFLVAVEVFGPPQDADHEQREGPATTEAPRGGVMRR